MKPIGSRSRLAVIVAIITLVIATVFYRQKQTTPFYVGSAVDEIWDYIHTDAVPDRFATRILPIHKSTVWTADLTTIKAETSFTCRKTSFAIRRTVYSYGDGVVTGVRSKWEIKWPF